MRREGEVYVSGKVSEEGRRDSVCGEASEEGGERVYVSGELSEEEREGVCERECKLVRRREYV